MATIKTSAPILNLKGEEILKQDKQPVTVGDVFVDALSADRSVAGKYKIYQLAKRIAENDKVDIDDADVEILRKVIEASTYNNVIIGRMIDLLTEKPSTKK